MTLRRRHALWLALASLALASTPSLADDAPKLAGTWTWKWKDDAGETHKHTLEVEGAGPKLVARERFDDKAAIKVDDLKLEGRAISFVVTRDGRRAAYEGKVESADTINGTVTVTQDGQPKEFGWTASREAPAK